MFLIVRLFIVRRVESFSGLRVRHGKRLMDILSEETVNNDKKVNKYIIFNKEII